MSYIKISQLPSLTSANLISSGLSIVPVVANISGNNVSYQTTVANVKTYVETGNLSVTGNLSTAGAVSIGTNLTVAGNLTVSGNTVIIGSNNYATTDNIIELHLANLANTSQPWTTDDGKDIGIRMHYYDGANKDAALVFARDTNYLEWYVNGAEGNVTFGGNVYGGMKAGSILLANTTDSTSLTTGTIVSNGGAALAGNLRTGGNIVVGGYANIVGVTTTTANISTNVAVIADRLIANSAFYTNSYVYAGYVQTNNSGTFGTTLNVQGTATVNALTSNGAVSGTTGTFGSGVITTTVNANANATVNALTVNTTATIAGGIQNTPVGNATANTGAFTTLTITGVSSNIIPTTANTYTLGNSANWFSNVYATAIQALYADLAEVYKADSTYMPGTVVVFGGTEEITVTEIESDTRVAGAISTDPAYLMNMKETGLPVALRGKIPVSVVGAVTKGDLLVTSTTPGYAISVKNLTSYDTNAVFAKSLETDSNTAARTIWAVIL